MTEHPQPQHSDLSEPKETVRQDLRPVTPLAGSLIHLIGIGIGLVVPMGALILGAALFVPASIWSGYWLTLIIGMVFVALSVPVLQIWPAAAWTRWSLEVFSYPGLNPWVSRLYYVAVQIAYTLLAPLLVVLLSPLIIFAGRGGAGFAAGLFFVIWILSLFWLPGKILIRASRWKEKTAKIIVWLTVASNCLVILALGAGGVAFYALHSSRSEAKRNIPREEKIAQTNLRSASQVVQNSLRLSSLQMAGHLCEADYLVRGKEKDCRFQSVSKPPQGIEPDVLSSHPEKIWLQRLPGGWNLCSVGGDKFFCTFVGGKKIGYGWSALSSISAQGNAQQNLGWPPPSFSKKQSEIENALDRISSRIKG